MEKILKNLKTYESFNPEEYWEEDIKKYVVFQYGQLNFYIVQKYINKNSIVLYDNYKWVGTNIMGYIKQISEEYIKRILNNEYGIIIFDDGTYNRIYYDQLPTEIKKNLSFDVKNIEIL